MNLTRYSNVKPQSKTVVPGVFHIGYPRTGTTFLQKGIFPQLADQLHVVTSRVGSFYAATSLSDLDGLYKDLSSRTVEEKTVMESEEVFSGGPFEDELSMPKKIAYVNPDAKIVICLRSQHSMMPSLYSLYVRKGGTLKFSDYVHCIIERRKLDYKVLVDRYCSVFGNDRVRVLFFEDLIASPDRFLDDFFGFIGIRGTPPWNSAAPWKNPRPPDPFIHISRCANLLLRTKAFSRTMSAPEQAATRARARLRNRLCAIPYFLANRMLGWGMLSDSALPIENIRRDVDEVYGQGNRALFSRLGRAIEGSGYPGERS